MLNLGSGMYSFDHLLEEFQSTQKSFALHFCALGKGLC